MKKLVQVQNLRLQSAAPKNCTPWKYSAYTFLHDFTLITFIIYQIAKDTLYVENYASLKVINKFTLDSICKVNIVCFNTT
jgi:hypothetical protein